MFGGGRKKEVKGFRGRKQVRLRTVYTEVDMDLKQIWISRGVADAILMDLYKKAVEAVNKGDYSGAKKIMQGDYPGAKKNYARL